MRNWVKGLGVTLLVSAVACSSSGSGGSVTSVPGSKSLATLTPAETMQLCTDTGAYVTRNVDLCKLTALLLAAFANPTTDAELQMACTSAYNSCKSGSSGQCNIGNTATCDATATVSQYSTCVSDYTADLKTTVGAVPNCNALTLADLNTDGGAGGTTTIPTSCTTLQTACPDITLPGG